MIRRGIGEEEEKGKGISPIVRSRSLGGEQTKRDCSVDLKLGSMDQRQDQRVSPPPLGSSKKPRAPSNETQTISCLVDGCNSDLSKCRDYHRRHKVCEAHSKTPKVMVGGLEQRFCQQCSRFHSLLEFDEEKRSCRKRLDGHNRRRRKFHPESLSMNSGSLFSNHQGNRYLQFGNPQLFQSTMVGSSRHIMTTQDDTEVYSRHQSLHLVDGQNSLARSYSCNLNGGRQYPFFQGDDSGFGNQTTVSEVSFRHRLVQTVASSSHSSEATSRVLVDSDCALSLLSPPLGGQSSGISQADMVQTNSIPMAQPQVGGLQYDSFLGRFQSQGMHDEPPMGLASHHHHHHHHHQQQQLHSQGGIFHMGADGSIEHRAPQTFPFSWE